MLIKATNNQIFNIYYGGWLQRTTLHLSEIYEIIKYRKNTGGFSDQKIKILITNLRIQSIRIKNKYLDYIEIITEDQILIKYYEDGLYVLQVKDGNIMEAKEKLQDYHYSRLIPTFDYIFAKGAPMPETIIKFPIKHSIFVSGGDFDWVEIDENDFGDYYSHSSSPEVQIIKTEKFYFVLSKPYSENSQTSFEQINSFINKSENNSTNNNTNNSDSGSLSSDNPVLERRFVLTYENDMESIENELQRLYEKTQRNGISSLGNNSGHSSNHNQNHNHKFSRIQKLKPINLEDLVEMLMFFREVKERLSKYMILHRRIWSKITEIRDKKEIKGAEIESVRSRLGRYQTTINLTRYRINQMEGYLRIRLKMMEELGFSSRIGKHLIYRKDSLDVTINYMKEVWNMTQKYMDEALKIILELREKKSKAGIGSFVGLTSLFITINIFRELRSNSWPTVTLQGSIFILGLIILTYLVDDFGKKLFENQKFKIKFGKEADDF